MAGITYFVALPFDVADTSILLANQSSVRTSRRDRACARSLASDRPYRRGRVQSTGDPAAGDFSDATVLRKFGDVPEI
jgi:hypothetical protein